METLFVEATGQITLQEDLLVHLGVRPGKQVTLEGMNEIGPSSS
jgi:hypothetical protein